MAGGGDLHDPLGVSRGPKARRGISPRVAGFVAVVVLSGAAYALTTHFVTDPHRDAPAGVATIATVQPAPPPVLPTVAPAASAPPQTGTDSTEGGVTVIRPGGAPPSGAHIINVQQALGLQLTPAPDGRLVEKGRYGPLPRVSADGAKALDVYARPPLTSLPASAPRIALVVSGMGVGETLTRTAVETLPGAVTLAFAPYGDHLDASVASARAHGHEVLLQAPMETFDATTQPHMLRVGGASDAMIDDLHWLMSRFTGYVGIANFLGAKFTSDDLALRPVLRDIGSRGLLFFDDGSSTRSLAPTLAPQLGVPAIRADVTLDGDAIEEALARLEATARSKGLAVGTAVGLPRTTERLARFAQGLEARGISLVPLSAAVDKFPSSTTPVVTRMP
jgi:polysaccharide deacetylase 2 family uncharacterized protein YibQ